MADPEFVRSRTELELLIERAKLDFTLKVERYNHLRDRDERTKGDLRRLEHEMRRYEGFRYDIELEYFRRLQLDGVLPSLPRAHVHSLPANGNHKNDEAEGEYDDGGNECDFEVGSKG